MFIFFVSKFIYAKLLNEYKSNEGIKEAIIKAKASTETLYDILVAKYVENENDFEFEDYINNILLVDPGNDIITHIKTLSDRGIINCDTITFRDRMALETAMGGNQLAILDYVVGYANKTTLKESQ
jgi:hypothetical protein